MFQLTARNDGAKKGYNPQLRAPPPAVLCNALFNIKLLH